LTVEPIAASVAVSAQESALGQPFAKAVDGAKLTKADAARNAAAEWSIAAARRSMPRLRVSVEPFVVRLQGLEAAPLVLVRNRDAGDLDGDGRENYTVDFMHWAPFSSVASDGSLVPLKPEDSAIVALQFFSLPEVKGPAGCTSCSRAELRGFYAIRRGSPIMATSGSFVGDWVSNWNASNYEALYVGTEGARRRVPLRVASGTVTIDDVGLGSDLHRRFYSVTVSSVCIFDEEDCDIYEAAMRVDGAELTIKTKSSPP
jgi:hypothetical protein